MNTAVTFNKD